MKRCMGILLLLGAFCAVALAEEPRYNGFGLDFKVQNESELVTAKITPPVEITCVDVALPPATNVKLEVVRRYPTLNPDLPVAEELIRMDLFRFRSEKDMARSISLEVYADAYPAVGHYRLHLFLPPGQHPSASTALGAAVGNVGVSRVVFVGTKSRAFQAVLAETGSNIAMFDKILRCYSAVLGREYAMDENGDLVEVEVERRDIKSVFQEIQGSGIFIREHEKAIAMPGVYETLEAVQLWAMQLLNPETPPTNEPMERAIAAVETLVLRDALLNLLYYADDTVESIGGTFDAVMETYTPQKAEAALQEWRAAETAVQQLWKELRDNFLTPRFLGRLETFSRIGPQTDKLIQYEADCDIFRRTARESEFLEAMTDYVDLLAELQREYVSLLEEGVTDDNRSAIRSLRKKITGHGADLQQSLRVRANAVRQLDAGEMPEIKKTK